MKKKIGVLVASLALAFGLVACGGQKAETKAESEKQTQAASEKASEKAEAGETVKIKIGATPSPHAEILEAAKDALKKKGVEIEIVTYNDYVQPNLATDQGEIDANYFQHLPYLEEFNKEKNTKIVSVGKVHYEPFGIYAGQSKDLKELKDGAKIAVPNDTTNEARALLLLEANGLIKLKEGAGINATKQDIVENPKNLDIQEIEAAQVARTLKDVDVAVVNGNYAIEAGLKVSDALAIEDSKSLAATTYANIIAVREGDEKSDATLALIKKRSASSLCDGKVFIADVIRFSLYYYNKAFCKKDW